MRCYDFIELWELYCLGCKAYDIIKSFLDNLWCCCNYFFVSVKGKEVLPLVDASVVKDVRRELTVIRDKVNSLLDALDITDKVPTKYTSDQQRHSSPGKDIEFMQGRVPIDYARIFSYHECIGIERCTVILKNNQFTTLGPI